MCGKKEENPYCRKLGESIESLNKIQLGNQIQDIKKIRDQLPKNQQVPFIEPQMKLQMTDKQITKIQSDLESIYNQQCKK